MCDTKRGNRSRTDFSRSLYKFRARYRKTTHLLLALDFGVKGKSDVDYLEKKTDIAVSGTQTIKVLENGVIGTKREFIRGWP